MPSTSFDHADYQFTPDGRYFVVKGRLWRRTNPHLGQETVGHLTKRLMAARRAVRFAKGDTAALQAARHEVNETKIALGERGPVWWTDGAPDFNRYLAKNTPYASWFASLFDQDS